MNNTKDKSDKLRLLMLESVGGETPVNKAIQHGHTDL
tara:strand:+ start:760 stop:870 length:111 start_codon:yes stop_codon:yes gene_type:complete